MREHLCGAWERKLLTLVRRRSLPHVPGRGFDSRQVHLNQLVCLDALRDEKKAEVLNPRRSVIEEELDTALLDSRRRLLRIGWLRWACHGFDRYRLEITTSRMVWPTLKDTQTTVATFVSKVASKVTQVLEFAASSLRAPQLALAA